MSRIRYGPVEIVFARLSIDLSHRRSAKCFGSFLFDLALDQFNNSQHLVPESRVAMPEDACDLLQLSSLPDPTMPLQWEADRQCGSSRDQNQACATQAGVSQNRSKAKTTM